MNVLKIKKRNLENKVKDLRDSGFVPGAIFGSTLDSQAIKLTSKELHHARIHEGEIYKVRYKNKVHFAKFGEIQVDPITQDFIHFTLVELPKTEQRDVDIPLKLTGTPVGVKKGGTLLVIKDELTVNGKPRFIPSQIEANISMLDIGEKLEVGDLDLPGKIETKEEENKVLAVCSPPIKEQKYISEEEIIETFNRNSRLNNTTLSEVF
jgi:large subunit ribosomal protein L25